MISVLIPTLNERAAMGELLPRIVTAMQGISAWFEVIIIDDRSPDGTAVEAQRVIKQIGADQHVRVVPRAGHRGLSNAILDGIRLAHGQIIVVMDADLSHPPESLHNLIAPLLSGEADVTVGSRYAAGGRSENWPLLRRAISRCACLMAKPVTSVQDATSGFFAFRRDVIEGVPLTPVGYKIGLEIFVKAKAKTIREIPYVFRDRTTGRSKLHATVVLLYLRHLASLYRYRFLRKQ